MDKFLGEFESEVTNLYKGYRMCHFSLCNLQNTYNSYKMTNPELNTLTIRDNDLNIEIDFNEREIQENSEGGLYQKSIAGNTISMFYNLWEDKYRGVIASQYNISKNKIKSNFFGELNYIRQSITHNNYEPTKKLNKLNQLKFVGDSSRIRLTIFEIEKIYELYLGEIRSLRKRYSER